MLLKLSILIIPAVILVGILYAGNKGDSIGGGGYDLSELVYSGVYMLFVVFWNIWVLASLVKSKAEVDKHNNKILLAIGFAVLIAAAVWFFKVLR